MSDDAPAGPVTLGQALATDSARRMAVTASYLFCVVGALVGFGQLDRDPRTITALLSPSASLLAPGLPAHRMWWVVLVALGIYVGWLWLPGNLAEERGRAIGYRSAGCLALLGLWFLVARGHGLTLLSVLTVVVVVALIDTLRVAQRQPSRRFIDRLFTQVGLAVTLGWMVVLAGDTIAAALGAHLVQPPWISTETWGILAVTALLGGGMALVRYLPGRLYIATAMAWGFVWIAWARVLGTPTAYGVAVVSLVSALLIEIAGVAVFLWARGRRRERVG